MFAEIIINYNHKALDMLFTYQISGDLVTTLKPGDRVVVPFGAGNRVSEGVVWRVIKEAKGHDFKAVLWKLEDKYSLTKSQLNLMDLMRKYFAATYQQAYQTVLPSAQKLMRHEVYTPLVAMGHLELNQTYDKETLLSVMSERQIKKYEEGGQLKKAVSFSIKSEPRVVEWVGKTFDSLESALTLVKKNAVKQQRLLRHVAGFERITLTQLTQATQAQRKDVMVLVDKGLLSYHVDQASLSLGDYHLPVEGSTSYRLTDEQAKVLDVWRHLKAPKRALLEGVTGSGKTLIYMQCAQETIKVGKQVLILVPEIALTPQLIGRLKAHVSDRVAVIHSKVSPRDKADIYEHITSRQVDVVVGARSALFAPFKSLGLLVIDEEHEGSYKSDQGPRYHTVHLAKALSKRMGIDLILGSATPSIESRHEVDMGRLQGLYLTKPAVAVQKNSLDLIDMRIHDKVAHVFSQPLVSAIGKALEAQDQVILFYNRKGYANYLQCTSCGHVHTCINCDISLSLISQGKDLKCSYCGYQTPAPATCSSCGATTSHKGIGLDKIELNLKDLFPNAKIAKLDASVSQTKTGLVDTLDAFKNGDIDILIGTQILAKGLDFPNVTLVGIISADQMLNMPDYQALERSYQLMVQVAGRAGRHQKPGRVLIQTYQPDHEVFKYLLTGRDQDFVREEKRIRDLLGYPPYGKLILIGMTSESDYQVKAQAQKIYDFYHHVFDKYKVAVQIFEPQVPHYSKIKNKYRYNIMIKSPLKHYDQLLKMLYNGLVKNKYDLLNDHCLVTLDMNPSSIT